MKILMTGACGFIGSHALEHFTSRGDEVLVVDKLSYAATRPAHEASHFYSFDICETKRLTAVMRQHKPDVLVNFAAETHVDNSIIAPFDFIHSNVMGVTSVLEACRHTSTKLCHVSTDEVYGPSYDGLAFDEDSELNPMNPYAASKAAGDMLVKSYHNTHGTQYLIVRPSNNYGPRQHHEKFIPKLLRCITTGEKFPLYGDGGQEREWTYVKDTGRAIRELLRAERLNWNEVYNLSSNVTFTNTDVIDTVLRIHNASHGTAIIPCDVVEHVKDRLGHDRKYRISAEKLNELINMRYTDTEQAMIQTVTQ